MPSFPLPRVRHATKAIRRRVARVLLLGGLSLLLFAASLAALAYHDLQSQIKRIDIPTVTDGPTREPVPDDYAGVAINILILGTDSRAGANNVDDSEGSEEVMVARSDTALIMHVSADRSRVDVVSIPRDTIVDIPSCQSSDGSTTEEGEGQFNTAFANGVGTSNTTKAIGAGVACSIKTVQKLTNIHIDEFMVIDFSGLEKMVSALGGVTLYVNESIDDSDYTGLSLEQGCQHLDGPTALQYARVRHGVADGSDISRISRQQNLMSAMLRAAQSKNLLTDADNLYSFAREALGTLTTSQRIGDLRTLTGLGQSIANIGVDHINFITMPYEQAPWDPDRVVPSEDAKGVWKALAKDQPVPGNTISSHADGSTPTPTDGTSSSPTPSVPSSTPGGSPTPAPGVLTTPRGSTTPDPAQQCR